MNTQQEELDYDKIRCSLCENNLPSGAFFTFMECQQCGDIIHDACHKWAAPKIIEDICSHKQLWLPFCQFCGINKYKIITPELWKSPIGKIIESKYLWNGNWSKFI